MGPATAAMALRLLLRPTFGMAAALSVAAMPSRAEEPPTLPSELEACRAIFEPIGAPDGTDGADTHTYVFANGSNPTPPVPTAIHRCHAAAFALRLNGITRDPDWVAEDITPDEVQSGAERSNSFFVAPDEALYSATLADYRSSGFDRGHQAPAGDFSGDQTKQDASFVLSNIGPQVGRCFNQGIWRELETAVRDLVTTRKRLIVFTGPIFEGPLRTLEDVKRARNPVQPLVPARETTSSDDNQPPGSAAIPDAFFKIVFDPQRGRAMAFRFPNAALCKRAHEDAEFRTTIDAIEEVTGFNFLPGLSHREQSLLEDATSPFWTW
ncbi:DNA/RNA non-specific endonuclease [Rhizobium halophytocola]|uniref:Endonuclease n=1 Tax=Rhizobium halophytocola TaxID=735519 RepID=A0ABS4E3M8_9HYPH|nr:DNA/RNA non-specific endonuclease [Rhizobium halophytocola]MBP1852554.1 endonuclease G [Rhizobium halophytocola]